MYIDCESPMKPACTRLSKLCVVHPVQFYTELLGQADLLALKQDLSRLYILWNERDMEVLILIKISKYS